jgi:peptide/nickel transport system substrate-binding protein
VRLLMAPELRTVFIGFDQYRDELLKSDVKGKNPFKDQRVRQAFNEAVDIQAIKSRVMRNQSHPTSEMFGPGVNGYVESKDIRYPYDPVHARKLLADAGYPDGFAITLDCPNDRYINDEAICQAVTIMLTRIGIKATLNSQPRLKHFADISAPNWNTSLFLLGWTPSTYDAHNALFNLAGTSNGVRGIFNDGRYSNPTYDALLDKIAVETDREKRLAMIDQASTILHKDAAFMPLHQQVVVWAARNNVEVQPLADNSFPLRLVKLK